MQINGKNKLVSLKCKNQNKTSSKFATIKCFKSNYKTKNVCLIKFFVVK